ncbi:uncharacterized protein LOC144456980 [Phascolarctos cinereus]
MELQVTVLHGYADWSLWQKQQGRNVPLGFWSRKLPPAGQNYTPFEQQLLAAYWALVETEHLTLNHEVVLRPAIPIMSWIMGTPASHKIGHAQESSIIKWKWYLQNRVKTGRSGISTLHEKVLELPKHSNDIDIPPKSYDQSPVSWNNGYDSLTPEQKKHAWFTDGSAKYIGSKRCWKAVAYNPSCNTILESSGEGQSSQWAELVAVYQVIQKEQGGQCHIYIYTDSWAVANGLAVWMPIWKKHEWKIRDKDVWGKELWEQIWEWCQCTNVSVFHVDAHVNQDSVEREYNARADELSKLQGKALKVTPREENETQLGKWVHITAGHLGALASYSVLQCLPAIR